MAQGASLKPDSLKGWALRAFNKFNNDGTMNLVAMVSFNVLTSILPLLLALITILVYVGAALGRTIDIAGQINRIMPANVQGAFDIKSWIINVKDRLPLLTAISIAGLLWGGSNLFGSIESAFAIIFRVKTRDFLPQKLMAAVMILLFAVLIPVSFIASFVLTAANTTLGKILPRFLSSHLAFIAGLVTSFVSLFILFTAIYTVVPNIPIRWRYAWRGAVVATVMMVIVNTLFPYYTSTFVNTKQYGQAALAGTIVTVLWLWFFSLVLLIGAQVNALFMGIGAWRHDLTRTLMDAHIPTTGGATTAIEALHSNHDPSVLNTPLGVVRDRLPAVAHRAAHPREHAKETTAMPPRADSHETPAQQPATTSEESGSRPTTKS